QPTLNALSDVTNNEDADLQTVGLSGISSGAANEVQNLTVTATSNNTGLIPNPTVGYTSASVTGCISYTPVADANGAATITVTVDDGGTGSHTVTRTFTVTVTAVNDAPTLDAISDPPTIHTNATAQTVNLTGITAGPNETQNLTVTAVSNNTGLI